MVKLMKWGAVLLLCLSMNRAEAQYESGWAEVEIDAGFLGLSTNLGQTAGSDALYEPGAFGTLVNFQLSRMKADKWGLWLGIVGSSSSNLASLEDHWLSEIDAIHPNAFISTSNTNSASFSRTHFMAGVLKRKELGALHLNYGAGFGAAHLTGIGNIEIQSKDLGSNARTVYNYDYGAYDAWSWSANLYADLDIKLYRSGKLQWMAFFRSSLMMHGQSGEVKASVEPVFAPNSAELIRDQGASMHLDMNFGVRLRLVSIDRWHIFRNKMYEAAPLN
jgi:hypothetical protein